MADADVVMGDEEKDVRTRAMRQVEFYFADTNLPYDKFMWTLYTKDPTEHWIPLSVISSFKRMREYQSRGLPWLIDVLKSSSEIQVKENPDDKNQTLIRRRSEVSEPKSAMERSVYAKGFPIPPCSTPSFPSLTEEQLQLKLESYFSSFAPVMSVRMRRDEAKKFKASVFVEFASPEGVDAFLLNSEAPDGKAKRVWEGYDLVVMTKEQYCDMKIKEKGLTGKAAVQRREMMTGKKFDAFKLMEKERKGAQPVLSTAPANEPVSLEFLGSKIEVKPDDKGVGTIDPEKIPFVPHASLRWNGGGDNVVWSDLKAPLKDLFEGNTPFIKSTKGSKSGFVGFHRALTDADLEKVQKALPVLDGAEATWGWLSEEDEKPFQIERAQTAARTLYRNHTDSPSRGGRGRGRGRGGASDRGGRGRGGKSNRFAERKAKNGREDKAKSKPSESRAGNGVPTVVAVSADAGDNGNGVPTDASADVGEKRKRSVDDDGTTRSPPPPYEMTAGDREENVSASKKVKVGDGEES